MPEKGGRREQHGQEEPGDHSVDLTPVKEGQVQAGGASDGKADWTLVA